MSRPLPGRANPDLYRPTPGLSVDERAKEQDAAAGGHEARLVTRPDGVTVTASVALRCYAKSRRVYAYLRWADPGRGTAERYLGDVSHCPDRATALRQAWSRAEAAASPAQA